MKLRSMVQWFARRTGIPEATVNETARTLQKAGLIQTGQPGRYGGSVMNEDDAAALVIALLAAEGRRAVVDAAEAVHEFGGRKVSLIYDPLQPEWSAPPAETLHGLDPDHTFIDLVRTAIRRERLLQNAASGRFVLGYEVSMMFPDATTEMAVGLSRPSQTIVIRYGDLKDGKMSPRERQSMTDEFSVRRTCRDRFFGSLHHALFRTADGHQGDDDE